MSSTHYLAGLCDGIVLHRVGKETTIGFRSEDEAQQQDFVLSDALYSRFEPNAKSSSEKKLAETFGEDAAIIRAVIAKAGDLPALEKGPFRDGFIAGIEELAARADCSVGDGGHQLQDLTEQVILLVSGKAALIAPVAVKPDFSWLSAMTYDELETAVAFLTPEQRETLRKFLQAEQVERRAHIERNV